MAKSVQVQSGASLSITAAGSLSINGSTGTGFANNGTFTNAGDLLIGNESNVAGVGVANSGTVNNNTEGYIQIDRTGSHAVDASGSGVFNNASLIQIGSLATVSGQGIRVSGGSFTNNLGGEIFINRTGTGVGGDGILSFGIFTNHAKITIGNIAFGAQDNIYNAGTFTNAASGEIKVDRAASSGNGIWNVAGTFQNAGQIALGANAVTGSSGILNLAIFNNNTGGDIIIDRPAGSGLVNANSGAVFTNVARIRIGQNFAVGNDGLANLNSATFRNNAGGDITIDQTNNDGIENTATFSNNACATLTVFDNINNSSSFTNAGFMTVSTTQAHTNSALTNDGTIAYPQGNPIPNVANNDVIALPRASLCTTYKPVLMLGGANSFTATAVWYQDEALTQPAGIYDQNTNTFTANSQTPGTTTLVYFSVTDNANTCTRTVSIPLTAATVTTSPNQSVVFGYGSNCTDITASSNSTGPLSFMWDTNAGSTATVNVCPQTTMIYTVTVTDGNGCQATGQTTINVQDVRCGNKNQNVTICYYGVTQCVSEKIATRYLKLGATIGGCDTGNTRIGIPESDEVPFKLSLKAYPNPVKDAVTLEVITRVTGTASFNLLDLTGHSVQSCTEQLTEGLNEVTFRFGSFPTGTYLIRVVDELNHQATVRVSKQ